MYAQIGMYHCTTKPLRTYCSSYIMTYVNLQCTLIIQCTLITQCTLIINRIDNTPWSRTIHTTPWTHKIHTVLWTHLQFALKLVHLQFPLNSHIQLTISHEHTIHTAPWVHIQFTHIINMQLAVLHEHKNIKHFLYFQMKITIQNPLTRKHTQTELALSSYLPLTDSYPTPPPLWLSVYRFHVLTHISEIRPLAWMGAWQGAVSVVWATKWKASPIPGRRYQPSCLSIPLRNLNLKYTSSV